MKKLFLAAAACCVLATPAFAYGGTNVKVVTVNSSNVAQVGTANTVLSYQGVLVHPESPTDSPIVVNVGVNFHSNNGAQNGALGTIPAE